MKEKDLYLSPETEVMEIKLEGMIAASVDTDSTTIDFNNPFPGGDINW
jgi:hypothetical protein